MINESYARFLAAYAHWPNNDAVGQIISGGPKNDLKNDLHIIGVVDDMHEENIDGDAGWQIYYPATQATPSRRRACGSNHSASCRTCQYRAPHPARS